jgi:hypothetical protein
MICILGFKFRDRSVKYQELRWLWAGVSLKRGFTYDMAPGDRAAL